MLDWSFLVSKFIGFAKKFYGLMVNIYFIYCQKKIIIGKKISENETKRCFYTDRKLLFTDVHTLILFMYHGSKIGNCNFEYIYLLSETVIPICLICNGHKLVWYLRAMIYITRKNNGKFDFVDPRRSRNRNNSYFFRVCLLYITAATSYAKKKYKPSRHDVHWLLKWSIFRNTYLRAITCQACTQT